MDRSTDRRVKLRSVSLQTAGQYKCEVSGEGPAFRTASFEGYLEVVGKFCAAELFQGFLSFIALFALLQQN